MNTASFALASTFALLFVACSGKFVETSSTGTGGGSGVGGSRTGAGGGSVGTGGNSANTGGNSASTGGKPGVVDCRNVACAPVSPPDGLCSQEAPSACCGFTDQDCLNAVNCATVQCAAFSEVPDGTCARPVTDCCRFQDPDCTDMCANVACPGASLPMDGKCQEQAPTPCCGYLDPDCGAKYNCDLNQIACDLFVQCEPGKVPTSNGSCYGPCVEPQLCLPGTGPLDCANVGCPPVLPAAPDGYCALSNPTAGCCGFPDLDCANVAACKAAACDAYIEVSDGKCGRKLEDCCRSQDPDCSGVGGQPRPAQCANAGVCSPLPSNGNCDLTPDNCCWGADPDCPL
ncbi:MAG: hypothetical protein SFV15_23835 [Polyangiaceae bacterium]|nr:hypothetical protein [Polyangiaceae bacterium]